MLAGVPSEERDIARGSAVLVFDDAPRISDELLLLPDKTAMVVLLADGIFPSTLNADEVLISGAPKDCNTDSSNRDPLPPAFMDVLLELTGGGTLVEVLVELSSAAPDLWGIVLETELLHMLKSPSTERFFLQVKHATSLTH